MAVFGIHSGAAFAAVIGLLVEVPVSRFGQCSVLAAKADVCRNVGSSPAILTAAQEACPPDDRLVR